MHSGQIVVLSCSSLLAALSAQSPLPPKPTMLGTPIRTHSGMVNAIDYSTDAGSVLTMSIDGDVRIWDARTGKRLQAWAVDGTPEDATFCGPKNERVVVGDSQAATLLVFDARTGKPGPKIPGLIRPAASKDGATLAAATRQGEIVFLDGATLAKSTPIKVGKDLLQLRFSPDGKQLLVEELLAGKAYLIDRAQAKVVAEVAHGAMRGGFEFLPAGGSLLGVAERMARRLSLPGGEVAGEWKLPLGTTGLVPRANGAEVIVTGMDGGLVHLELANCTIKHEFEAHRGNISRMVVSPDGKVLVSGGWDGGVRFWSLETGAQLFTGPDHDSAVTALAVAAEGKTLASGSWDNSTILWGADSKAAARVRAHEYLVTAVGLATDGTWWSTSQDRTLRQWHRDGKEKAKHVLDDKAFALGMVMVGDTTAILAMSDHGVRWFDLASGKEAKRWQGHGSPVLAVVADPRGEFVASLEEEGTVIVWNAATGEPQHRWIVHEGGATALAHLGNGVLVATGDGNTLARYDGKAGKELQRLSFKHENLLTGLEAITALPGRDFLVAAEGGAVFVLAAADLKLLGTVDVPSGVQCLTASADGSTVAAGLADGTIATWKPAAAKPKK